MDKLIRHAREQGEIFEALTFFNTAMAAIKKDRTEDYQRDLSRLFQKDVVEHLKFEEEQIFPLVFTAGGYLEKRLISSLQREHKNILKEIDRFKALTAKSDLNSGREARKRFDTLAKKLIRLMLSHSRREDKKLFPLLKNICHCEKEK